MKFLKIIFALAAVAATIFFASATRAATVVNSDIDTDTVWTEAESPYSVAEPIFVLPGATLTVEPGVTVQFADDAYLDVMGTLVANGMNDSHISFTKLPDGTSWQGFYFDFAEGVHISNIDISFSADGLYFWGATASISNVTGTNNEHDLQLWEGSDVTLAGASFTGSRYESIYAVDSKLSGLDITIDGVQNYAAVGAYGADLSLTDSHIKNISVQGISLEGGSLNLTRTDLRNISRQAIVGYSDADIHMMDSTIDTAGEGINIWDGVTLDLTATTISHASDGVLDYGGVSVHMDKAQIRNNDSGITIYPDDSLPNSMYTVSHSVISDNTYDGIYNGTTYTVDFSKTYWGDPSGPKNDTTNLLGLGNAVSDGVIFDPWSKCDSNNCKTPVLIVPGVLGTEMSKQTDSGPEKLWLDIEHTITDWGDEFMDSLQFTKDLKPTNDAISLGDIIRKKSVSVSDDEIIFFDYAAHLIDEFENQGYQEGTDLFILPYDWRYGVNDDTIAKLKQKITDIMIETGSDKVDVVAHSTGGLLVKKYAMDYPMDNHIGKAVFVGVPNTGAPKAIKVLLSGDSFSVPLLAQSEMKKLAQNFPVVYDLSPSKAYYDHKGSYVKVINQNFFAETSHDLDFDETNDFLITDHTLNSGAVAISQELHTAEFDDFDMRSAGIDLYAIDGCKTGTIGKIKEVRYATLLGGTETDYDSPEETPGDGTVPLESATNLPITEDHKYYALKADHAQMMSQDGIRQEIVNMLAGTSLSTASSSGKDLITQDINACKLNGHAISIYSPLSIDIVDADGNHAGPTSGGASTENTIPNADYELMGDHKFVYLPTDDGQTYTISLKGTGTGVFTLTDATIIDNAVTQTQVFEKVSVTEALSGSFALDDNQSTLSLDTDGGGAVDSTLFPTKTLSADESQNYSPIRVEKSETVETFDGSSPDTSAGFAFANYSNPPPLTDSTQSIQSIPELAVAPEKAIVVATPSIKEIPETSPRHPMNEIKGVSFSNSMPAIALTSADTSNRPIFVIVGLVGFMVLFFLGRYLIKR